jgi:hypothetical protein
MWGSKYRIWLLYTKLPNSQGYNGPRSFLASFLAITSIDCGAATVSNQSVSPDGNYLAYAP